MTTTTTIYTREEILEHRKAWIADLRSGKRKQTTGTLKSRNGSYCCLGVACDIAGVPVRVRYDGSYFFGKQESPEDEYSDFGYEPSETELPRDVQEWLGVSHLRISSNPALDVTPVFGGLERPELGEQYYPTDFNPVTMNDDWGFSFAQIADMIEYFGFQGDEIGFK